MLRSQFPPPYSWTTHAPFACPLDGRVPRMVSVRSSTDTSISDILMPGTTARTRYSVPKSRILSGTRPPAGCDALPLAGAADTATGGSVAGPVVTLGQVATLTSGTGPVTIQRV